MNTPVCSENCCPPVAPVAPTPNVARNCTATKVVRRALIKDGPCIVPKMCAVIRVIVVPSMRSMKGNGRTRGNEAGDRAPRLPQPETLQLDRRSRNRFGTTGNHAAARRDRYRSDEAGIKVIPRPDDARTPLLLVAAVGAEP